MSTNERVCIFIDGSNLYHSLKHECDKTNLDFTKFIDWLVEERKLVRAYYYNVPLHASSNLEQVKSQQRFFDGLKRISYFDVRLGRLEPRGNTYVEKGVDVQVAVDMLSMAVRNIYDTAILVSCDGDYAVAIRAVKETGKHVEVACFPKAYHVREAADRVRDLNKDTLRDFWRQVESSHITPPPRKGSIGLVNN